MESKHSVIPSDYEPSREKTKIVDSILCIDQDQLNL